jgi:hypothetical protein
MSMRKRILLSVPILFYSTPTINNVPLWTDQKCQVCIFQRDGNIPYILRRYLHEPSGPDENVTFGHCFVCIRCPQDKKDFCRGWWPADPDGGDYAGDEGAIYADQDEKWDRASCQGITWEQAERSKAFIMDYAQNFDYQVINQGARSCLGYCEDVAMQIPINYSLPWNDYTVPGDMRFPTAIWSYENQKQISASSFLETQRGSFLGTNFQQTKE